MVWCVVCMGRSFKECNNCPILPPYYRFRAKESHHSERSINGQSFLNEVIPSWADHRCAVAQKQPAVELLYFFEAMGSGSSSTKAGKNAEARIQSIKDSSFVVMGDIDQNIQEMVRRTGEGQSGGETIDCL